MTWSESGYTNEQNDNPQNKLEGQSDKVYNTTDFLSKFEGNQKTIVSACMQEIQSDIQLKEGFDNLLKSGISNDLINKIKQELEEGIKFGIDDVTLKDSIQGIIAENVENFRIGSMAFEGTLNQMNQNEETAAQNEETAAQNEETAAQNNETAEKRVQMVKEEENRLLDYRTQLLVGHDDVKEKTEKKAEIAQQQLPEETKNKLKAQGYDDEAINKYILLRVTLNEVKNDSSFDKNAVAQFEKGVNELSTLDAILKGLDNACNIPDTNLSSFSGRNIAQTRTELFNEDIGNDSLRQAKQSNLESRDYSEMLPEMGNEEMFKKYGQFLKGDLRKSWDEYKDNYLGFVEKINSINVKKSRGEELTTEEQSLLSMEGTIKGIKEKMDNDTKNMAEELCIISQIKGMYMCMGESADFDLNKANEIQSENGVLTLNGHIDGVDFAIRQDTNNPEARLQTSKKIAKSPDGNTFTIGGLDNFMDSNFILPSQKEIFDTISETVKSGVPLENFDNPGDYLDNLQSSIMGKMDEKYENTKYVHHYMQDQVKGEKVVADSLNLLKKIKPDISTNLAKPINLSNNEQLYSFVKMLNFNVENSTDTEKDKLNECIAKIIEITENYKNTNGIKSFDTFNYPPIIENYLKNQNWLSGGTEDSRLSSVFDMLSYYNLNSKDTRANKEGTEGVSSKVVINDLYRDLFEFTTGPSEVCVKRENENQENQDKKQADEVLDLENPDLWPPVDYA